MRGVIHVFAPSTRHVPSACLVAFVRMCARSEPKFGSVKTAVDMASPDESRGSQYFFCSSVPPPRINSAAISERVPSEPTPMYARLSSSVTTHMATLLEALAAVLFGDGEPEDAHLRHLVDEPHGDQDVLAVHVLSDGNDLVVGEFSELTPDRVESLVF